MILSRRRVHLYSSTALALLLPIVFIAGVGFRPRYPANSEAAGPAFAGFATASEAEAAIANFPKEELARAFVNPTLSSADGDALQLELQPKSPPSFPDPLLYWQEGSEPPEELGANAILLGPFVGTSRRIFSLPPQARSKNGYLAVYSGLTGEIAVTFALPAIAASGNALVPPSGGTQ